MPGIMYSGKKDRLLYFFKSFLKGTLLMSRTQFIFIVENTIYLNDGYKARAEMELELIGDKVDCCIVVPYSEKVLSFKKKVKIIKYHVSGDRYFSFNNKKKLCKCLNKIIGERNNCIIYCEALSVAIEVLNFCKKRQLKMVFDCHGSAPDETYYCHPNILGRVVAFFKRVKQQEVTSYSDLIVTVSNAMYNHLSTNTKHVLLPMIPAKHFFDEHSYREEYRKKNNIPKDAQVFVYAGQNQKWQMSEETVDFYKRIEDRKENSFLLILTGNVADFSKMCEEKQIKNYKVLKVPYNDMPKYLDTADFGFCLRADNNVNRVASPTKILEYLSRNVKPVITDCIGDFSNDLKRNGYACIVDINDPIPKLTKDKNFNSRKYVLELARTTANNYLQCLKEL